MQLLYVANRYERKHDLQRWLDGGLVLVVRSLHVASSIAYGEAPGLDPVVAARICRSSCPRRPLTIAARYRAGNRRCSASPSDRDRYERDLAMQARVRDSYRRQAAAQKVGSGWTASVRKDVVAADVFSAGRVTTRAAVSRAHLRDPAFLQRARARFEASHPSCSRRRPAPRSSHRAAGGRVT